MSGNMSRARAISSAIATQERSMACINAKLDSYRVHYAPWGNACHCGRWLVEATLMRGSDDWSKVTCKSCLRGKPA